MNDDWLFAEDKAMKAKFAEFEIANPDGTEKPVPTYFALPEREVREAEWPHVLLERSNVSKADDREHRGATRLSYGPGIADPGAEVVHLPDGSVTTWEETGYDPKQSPFRVPEWPIPYNIDYTVTVNTRFDRQLTQAMNRLNSIDFLPHRFGYLEIPEDGTVRSLDVIGGPGKTASRDANDKRIFTGAYTVRVASEINLYALITGVPRVSSVDINLIRWLSNQ